MTRPRQFRIDESDSGGAQAVSAARINVLGPVTVRAVVGGTDKTIELDWGAGEAVLREIAARGNRGAQQARIAKRLQRRTGYDAAGDLRKLLVPYGLTVSRGGAAGYHLVDADGFEIPISSDLEEFRQLAREALGTNDAFYVEIEQPDTTQLVALERTLQAPLQLWRTQTRQERVASLTEDPSSKTPNHDLELDGKVRLALAAVRVAICERMQSAPVLEHARESINDLYDFASTLLERERLQSRLAHVLNDLALDREPPPVAEVFLSAPMAAAENYDPVRRLTLRVAEALRENCGVRTVYCAAETISEPESFEEPSIGLQRNIGQFRAVKAFVMLLPESLPSSVLVEAGMALAFGTPSVYFVRDQDHLPWILRDAAAAGAVKLAHARIIRYDSDDDLIRRIKIAGVNLFPPGLENPTRSATV